MAAKVAAPLPCWLNLGTYALLKRFCASVAPPIEIPANAGVERLKRTARENPRERIEDTMLKSAEMYGAGNFCVAWR